MIENPFDPEEEKTRQQKEFKLQCHISKKHQIYFPHVLMTAIPNRPSGDTKASRSRDGQFKKMMGVRAGVSDIAIWWGYEYPHWSLEWLMKMLEKIGFSFSRMHAGMIELKIDTDTSSAQNKWMSAFHHLGGKEGTARSWKEYYKLLCFWGITPTSVCTIFDEPDTRSEMQKKYDAFEFMKP